MQMEGLGMGLVGVEGGGGELALGGDIPAQVSQSRFTFHTYNHPSAPRRRKLLMSKFHLWAIHLQFTTTVDNCIIS